MSVIDELRASFPRTADAFAGLPEGERSLAHVGDLESRWNQPNSIEIRTDGPDGTATSQDSAANRTNAGTYGRVLILP